MSELYTEKIRLFSDLIVPVTACPFGDPIDNCPFILFHQIGNEHDQIAQINLCPAEELDKFRAFHRACTQRYMSGEWKPENPKFEEI